MALSDGKIRLCAFPHGSPLAWRLPGSRAEGLLNLKVYMDLVQTLERGLFDAVFFADNLSLNPWGAGNEAAHLIGNAAVFEPLTLLSALSARTEHIGLMATASTTYNHPFHVARKFASLDHLSGGRAGWNVVTSMTLTEAANFGLTTQMSSEERYARANAFVDCVTGLWSGWDKDAIINDVNRGMFFDPGRIRALNRHDAHFSIAGPLNIPRPPQGKPVICQAGTSDAGLDLAARTADLVFVNGRTLDEGRGLYKSMKARAAGFGRAPGDLAVLPGLFFIIGDTEAEAQRMVRDARDAIDEPTAKRFLSVFLPGIDLEPLEYDAPLPDTPAIAAAAARAQLKLEEKGRRLTIRELGSSHGNHWHHLEVVGTAEQVADLIETWLRADAADGFNLFTMAGPEGYGSFVDGVVPELQRRGVFRTSYEGATLRENLGLPKVE